MTMAITKIHPIKSTLHLAINYIVNDEKTDEQLLVSTHKCHESSAHTRVLNPLSSLTNLFKKVLMKGKIYRIKSRLLIRKYLQSYPLLFCNPCFYISFFKQKRRLDFTLITFAIYQILLLYFNFLIDSLSDSIFICSIAIAFNFSNLSNWLMPSFINTALRFSRLERQTSCDISA